MTVSGIAAISVIAGQEVAKRQDSSFHKSAPSAQTQPLGDHAETEVLQDTVNLSASGQTQTSAPSVYGRWTQQANLAAIAAYRAIQPDIVPATLTVGGDEAAPEVLAQNPPGEAANVTG